MNTKYRAAVGFGVLLAGTLEAQTPPPPMVFYACYVISTGTVYRILEPGLSMTCARRRNRQDVQFSWTDGTLSIRVGDTARGDLSGYYPNPIVTGLQGRAVVPTPPSSGQVLTFDGTVWKPAASPSGVADHGQLTGLLDDDHPQYLLTDGVRLSTGFAVSGLFGSSATIPSQGAGTRIMWYPRKGAFRVGTVLGTQWDDASIGSYSVAMGYNTTASGQPSTAMGGFTVASDIGATAMGYGTTASGNGSTAMGGNTTANAQSSTAMGQNTLASGIGSTAMGLFTTASGVGSTTMGQGTEASGTHATAMGLFTTASGGISTAMGSYASTGGWRGSFVYGDASTQTSVVTPTGANQFVVRASGGFLLRTSTDLSTGCDLPAGSGVWNCTSSRSLKTDFKNVDGEAVLSRVRELPVQFWGYKTEPGVRHLGPFAEDFHHAFGLGTSETSIGLLDIAGVSLAAAQALERRTQMLGEQLAAKDRQIEDLRAALAAVVRRLQRLEQVQR